MRLGWLVALAACGDNKFSEQPYFGWDDRHDVGAYNLDHIVPDDPGLLDAIDSGTTGGAVVLFYGHDPPHGTSYETIAAVLDRATANGLAILTYADLAHGPGRAGISLSFDDADVDDWFAMRDLLRQHRAHVSYFVTSYTRMTEAEHDELRQLAADGHTLEAHGVNHEGAVDYIAAHGLDAYLADEVQPSIDVLRADGYDPVAYAHPGGANTPALDAALVSRIRFARGISGAPR